VEVWLKTETAVEGLSEVRLVDEVLDGFLTKRKNK
jgi:hypothetical protein